MGSLSHHTAEKWSRFCPFLHDCHDCSWVNWCQFSQILNVLLCLINHQAFLELDVLKGMNLQMWDATGALHLHEKEKENQLSLAWPPESAALNSLVPPLNSVPLLERLLISIYQTYHISATNVWLNQNKNTRRHMSHCGFKFYFVVVDDARVFLGFSSGHPLQ